MWRDLEPDHIVGHVGRLIINDCQSLTLIFLYDNELSSKVLFKKKTLELLHPCRRPVQVHVEQQKNSTTEFNECYSSERGLFFTGIPS